VERNGSCPLVQGENQVDFSGPTPGSIPTPSSSAWLGRATARNWRPRSSPSAIHPTRRLWCGRWGPAIPARPACAISYLLGNLSKSFNYRAVAANDESTLTLSQYMRLQNFANEEYASTEIWARVRQGVPQGRGLNETKEMLMAKYPKVPVRKDLHLQPGGVQLPGPGPEQAAGADALCAEERQAGNLGVAPLPYGKVRIFIEGAGKQAAQSTAFLGETGASSLPSTTR